MELYEVMRTAFSARDFTGGPVPEDVLHRILDHARFAPSGGNRQGWHVISVREQETRAALIPLIATAFRRYLAQQQAGESPWNTIDATNVTPADVEAVKIPEGSVERLVFAPTLLFVCVDLRVVASMDSELDRVGIISGASIYPFAWNILTAARNEGYGGTLTTFIAAEEPALQKLLGVPEHVAFAAMIPMGKPVKQLTKLRRKPVEEFAVYDRWGGAPIGGSIAR